ncbi:MAG: UDP-N-acetylmuramate dehydrogenase, partial [Chitinophagales bacterium]|nr:UDP-N-acetylmuramate dehydrogenase [Chitinophagales bacterium]
MTNNYLENFSLKSYNTFGIDVKCRYFIEVESIEKLKSVLEEKISPSIFILGGGSNILFTHDYSGLVIKINIKGKQVEKEEGNHVFVKVYAGESWHEFVLWTIENGWGGLENLSLIPGSCGAAPMQNIGAYGVEIKDVFVRLEALHRESLEVHTFDHEACHFGYRESDFKRDLKDQYIILSIVYRLSSRPRFNTSYG